MNIHYEYNITCIEKGKWVYKTEIRQECWHTKETENNRRYQWIFQSVLLYP